MSKILEEANSIADKIAIFNEDDQNPYNEVKKIILDKKIKLIVTVARGTSDCAALYASYLFAKYLGLPTYSLPPSQITLEKTQFDFSSTLVLIISQSGLSEDLIECEKASRTMGALTLVLTNNNRSPMIETANYFFNMYAGKEESVAATKSFVLTLLNLIKLVSIISDKHQILSKINDLPSIINRENQNNWEANIVDSHLSNGFIISRGLGYALSTEISLKFKELCQEQIEPYSSAEVMHGPKSLIENKFKLFVLILNDKSGNIVLKEIDQLKKMTDKVYEILPVTYGNSDFVYQSLNSAELDSIILMTKLYPWMIKYSKLKGLDPDNPRYLTKVTRTF
jgi:glucosamine--fructose-6-phosphate aminotransferase (isomerizing)